ncbi:hypothetical protein TRFO_19216 [Tritrichomonas foetus]|uniref:Uncharacterized protein n=1 Tax=Tritrichomonas foetus TaxID=1144522 RepID=A0A1J4KNH3_9EUKA|nr:hypothetical protein TRFO_19216 [Tritrichomonas foetus]|eukprot:OHT11340.1 hypothetical protein TRFO_19216 [Tritrichomonas foetus]
MHCACEHNSLDFILCFFKYNDNLCVLTNPSLSWSPLHIAVNKNSIQAVSALLKYKININLQGKNGVTPLHLAAQIKSNSEGQSILSLLIENGANPNSLDNDFETPLFSAIHSNNVNAVKELIKAGADVNASNKHKMLPIHYSCKYGCSDIVAILLDNNAEVNIIDHNDLSPLHYAVARQDKKIAELLIRHGADPLIRNSSGKSTFSLANQEMILVLRKAVSNLNIYKKRQDALLEAEAKVKYIEETMKNIENQIKFEEEEELFIEEEEEEAGEMTEDERVRFEAFKQGVEIQIAEMQSDMVGQIKDLVKLILDIRKDINKKKRGT